jgi:hypothetical protein
MSGLMILVVSRIAQADNHTVEWHEGTLLDRTTVSDFPDLCCNLDFKKGSTHPSNLLEITPPSQVEFKARVFASGVS